MKNWIANRHCIVNLEKVIHIKHFINITSHGETPTIFFHFSDNEDDLRMMFETVEEMMLFFEKIKEKLIYDNLGTSAKNG